MQKLLFVLSLVIDWSYDTKGKYDNDLINSNK